MDGGNQPIFEDRFVEMRITRRRLLKTTGAAGAVALATSATPKPFATQRCPWLGSSSWRDRELDADGDLGIEADAGRITLPI